MVLVASEGAMGAGLEEPLAAYLATGLASRFRAWAAPTRVFVQTRCSNVLLTWRPGWVFHETRAQMAVCYACVSQSLYLSFVPFSARSWPDSLTIKSLVHCLESWTVLLSGCALQLKC